MTPARWLETVARQSDCGRVRVNAKFHRVFSTELCRSPGHGPGTHQDSHSHVLTKLGALHLNVSTQESEAGGELRVEVQLVYTASSRLARAPQRDCPKIQKQRNKQTEVHEYFISLCWVIFNTIVNFCVWCVLVCFHVYTLPMCMARPEADTGSCPLSFFYLTHWNKASQLNSVLAHTTSLASQLATRIPCLCLQRLEVLAGCHTHQ